MATAQVARTVVRGLILISSLGCSAAGGDGSGPPDYGEPNSAGSAGSVGSGGGVSAGGSGAAGGGGVVGGAGATGGSGGAGATGSGGSGATGAGGSGATGGTGGEAGAPSRPPVPLTPSFPIDVAPNEQWTWVPIEGTKCADGTQAGVGVNFTTKSRDLLIWFQGNGVCYNATSCTMFAGLLTGMGPDPLDHLWWGDKNTPHIGVFNRADPGNPWRAASYIAFPHCGVDGHSADKVSSYPPLAPIHQHGYANVTLALPRIWPASRTQRASRSRDSARAGSAPRRTTIRSRSAWKRSAKARRI